MNRPLQSRVAASLLVLSLAGCGVQEQEQPSLADRDSVPFGLLARDATTLLPPAAAQTTDDVTLCFIDDDGLRVVSRPLASPVSPIDVLRALTQPPSANEASLRTAVGPSSLVTGVRVDAGVAQVDLDPAIASLGGNDQLLAVAQIVCTLTARPGIGQVAFTISGSAVDVPRGDGSLTTSPVSRDDYANLLS